MFHLKISVPEIESNCNPPTLELINTNMKTALGLSYLAAFAISANSLFGQAAVKPLEDKAALVLDPFSVSASNVKGYGVTDTVGGSRITTSIFDTSMSITVINREFLDDVGAFNNFDALRWVSGLGPAAQPGIGAYSLRGQLPRSGSGDFIDGLQSAAFEQETEFIDRWEVVKGPAGTLFGEHNLGGLMNRVYKVPQQVQHTTIKSFYSTIGSTYQASIDNTGPIGRSGELTYRLIGVFRRGATDLGDNDDNKNAYYATLQYKPKNSGSKFWGRFEYRAVEPNLGTFSGVIDGAGQSSLKYFPRQIVSPWPNNTSFIYKYYEAGYTSQFSGSLGDWSVRIVMRNNDDYRYPLPQMSASAYTFLDASGNSLGVIGGALAIGQVSTQPTFAGTPWTDIKITTATPNKQFGHSFYPATYFDVTGAFDTGPISHRLLFYAQSTKTSSRTKLWSLRWSSKYGGSSTIATGAGSLDLTKAFSLVHPFKLNNSQVNDVFENEQVIVDTLDHLSRISYGIQDNMSFWKNRVILVGGARYDFVQNEGTHNYRNGVSNKPQSTPNWVYKGSVVMKPFRDQEGIAFFLNYSETFSALLGELIQGSGIPLKNQIGNSKEAGIKLQLFDGRLLATAAYFKTELNNFTIFAVNPATTLNEFTQGGIAPAKGWDADMTWTINDNWMMLGGASKVDSKDFRGLRLRGVMNGLTYQTLLRYSAPSTGQFRGFSAGAGVKRISDRLDTTNTITAPGYSEYTAFFTYIHKNWRYQINVDNLTDVLQLWSLTGRVSNPINDPRGLRFGVQYDF